MNLLYPLMRPLRQVLRGLFLSSLSWTVSAEVIEVEISKYQYHPQVVTIQRGDTVHWTNLERRQYHSVILHREGSTDAKLDSGYLFPGDRWNHTFTEAGYFAYLCGPHPEMSGRIEVEL